MQTYICLSPWRLCTSSKASSREGIGEGKLPMEERGDAKLHLLSPRRHTLQPQGRERSAARTKRRRELRRHRDPVRRTRGCLLGRSSRLRPPWPGGRGGSHRRRPPCCPTPTPSPSTSTTPPSRFDPATCASGSTRPRQPPCARPHRTHSLTAGGTNSVAVGGSVAATQASATR
jgi:hypothetical protein